LMQYVLLGVSLPDVAGIADQPRPPQVTPLAGPLEVLSPVVLTELARPDGGCAARRSGEPRRRREATREISSEVTAHVRRAASPSTITSSRPSSRAHARSVSAAVARRTPSTTSQGGTMSCRQTTNPGREMRPVGPAATKRGRSPGTGGTHQPLTSALVRLVHHPLSVRPRPADAAGLRGDLWRRPSSTRSVVSRAATSHRRTVSPQARLREPSR
jgi:hypothetical protein